MKNALLFLLALSSLAFSQTKTVSPTGGGLNATDNPSFRTALGGTTIGQNLFTLANPSAITFPQFNADNTVTSLSAADFRTAIGGTTFGKSVFTNNAGVALFDRFLYIGSGQSTSQLIGTSSVLTSLGATTVGTSFLTLANPSAITFPRVNADNTVTALSAADFRTAIGAGTGGTTLTDSSSLASTLSDETGTGVAVFGASPTLTTPIINLGSDATGDVYYRSAGGLFTRLPIGTNGQVLAVSSGGLPSWSTITIPSVEVTLAGAEVLANKTLSIGTVFTSSPTMTLGSDATGDIYYRNAGGLLTRLGPGSDGQVLTLASGIPSWAAASGALTSWAESVNTSAPNDTVPVVLFLATNAATNVDAAISPKGTGALTAHVADNTATGGNKRGNYAVDLQTQRGFAANVASGINSVIAGGFSNTASGARSAVLGGEQNTASGQYSTATGYYATTRGIIAAHAIAPGRITVDGDTQRGLYLFRRSTTDATPVALTSDTAAADTTNQVILPNNSTFRFRGMVVGRKSDGTSTTVEFTGAIERGANAASTVIIGTVTYDVVEDAGAAAWDVTATADTTNGGLAITVTGEANTIKWSGSVTTQEVVF